MTSQLLRVGTSWDCSAAITDANFDPAADWQDAQSRSLTLEQSP
ncbi:hypothetical protein [Actinacidiphila yeochonensis]|nr:hypothetical protein [Actinacidiphila yeochonensis]